MEYESSPPVMTRHLKRELCYRDVREPRRYRRHTSGRYRRPIFFSVVDFFFFFLTRRRRKSVERKIRIVRRRGLDDRAISVSSVDGPPETTVYAQGRVTTTGRCAQSEYPKCDLVTRVKRDENSNRKIFENRCTVFLPRGNDFASAF